MVGVGMIELVIICSIIVMILIQLYGHFSLSYKSELFHERLDQLEQGVAIVGTVLNEIPNILPKYEINQNPLTQLMDAFQQWRGMMTGENHSLSAPPLRDDNGRFTDGETQEIKE